MTTEDPSKSSNPTHGRRAVRDSGHHMSSGCSILTSTRLFLPFHRGYLSHENPELLLKRGVSRIVGRHLSELRRSAAVDEPTSQAEVQQLPLQRPFCARAALPAAHQISQRDSRDRYQHTISTPFLKNRRPAELWAALVQFLFLCDTPLGRSSGRISVRRRPMLTCSQGCGLY